jgi:hypothetical protein
MVYPRGMLAIESAGEFVAPKLHEVQEDAFTANLSAYYGLGNGFSVQGSLVSEEKPRYEFEVDGWAVRGVYGVYGRADGRYSLDAILEHRAVLGGENRVLELSAPSILRYSGFTTVLHPVVAFDCEAATGLRGHMGVFYNIGRSIVGIGAEHESNQSSSTMGRRLIKGESGTSLFLGGMTDPSLYLQNEFKKGWGSNGKDIGFAATLKFLFPQRL